MYYIQNINITFSFIGLSETLVSETNQELLEIPGYRHDKTFVSIRRKVIEQVSTYTIVFNTKEGTT